MSTNTCFRTHISGRRWLFALTVSDPRGCFVRAQINLYEFIKNNSFQGLSLGLVRQAPPSQFRFILLDID